jgi:hypothetical protein
MAYKIIVSPRAQKEIENAIDYYALYSAIGVVVVERSGIGAIKIGGVVEIKIPV